MSEKYLLQIWEQEVQDSWELKYYVCDPEEILERIRSFKENNKHWREWMPKIYSIKEVNLDIKATSEYIKSFMDIGTYWQEIEAELDE